MATITRISEQCGPDCVDDVRTIGQCHLSQDRCFLRYADSFIWHDCNAGERPGPHRPRWNSVYVEVLRKVGSGGLEVWRK